MELDCRECAVNLQTKIARIAKGVQFRIVEGDTSTMMIYQSRNGGRSSRPHWIESQIRARLRAPSWLHGAAILWVCLAVGCESRSSVTIAPHEKESAVVDKIPEPLCIRLTGTEHRWRAEYPAADGTFSRSAPWLIDLDLHVPVGTSVVFILKSSDYIYTLAIPEFGVKEIAVPELEFRMAFRPMHVGQYPVIGEELCGAPGLDGPARLIVETRAEYQAWLRRRQK